MQRSQRGGPGVREGVTEENSQDGSALEPRGLSLPGSSGGGRAKKTGWPWLGPELHDIHEIIVFCFLV